jgi:uncharacterized tellurite resistance protein B-like protein
MFEKLRQVFSTVVPATGPADPLATTRQAVAALLVEIARADHDEQAVEHAAIEKLLATFFGIDGASAAELLTEARQLVDDAVSLREFTAPLHRQLGVEDKQRIIGLLWKAALADRELDKYEDYLVGKVAELLYVPRGDVVRLRYRAAEELALKPD